MRIGKFRIWVMTMRPKTLVASFAPVVIGSAFAVAHDVFNMYTLIFTLLTAALVQILTNFANDYFDFIKGTDTKERVGPKRGLHKDLISLKEMRVAIILTIILTILSSIYLIYIGGALIFLLMIVSVILALLYTAGPVSLSYTGFADIFVFIFFGPVATVATFWLQTKMFDPIVLISSIAPGCLSTAMLAINNIRDYKTDKAAGKKTLVVRFGIEFGKIEYLTMLIIAFLVPFVLWYVYPLYSVMLIVCFVMLTSIRMVILLFKTDSAVEIGKLMMNTSFLLLSYTLIFIFSIFYANR
ncbi:MAG: 1,4-dihydroxy-2-naphthoate octaprenyltransferase [Rhabdochlamydiaceae bacterium]|nr:1,4-dihydroxy-2-naphthoate octaprenyltransferase [Candidatus Amphrikana amoebophyrae]